MKNVAIKIVCKGRGGNDVQHKKLENKNKRRIWITIIINLFIFKNIYIIYRNI